MGCNQFLCQRWWSQYLYRESSIVVSYTDTPLPYIHALYCVLPKAMTNTNSDMTADVIQGIKRILFTVPCILVAFPHPFYNTNHHSCFQHMLGVCKDSLCLPSRLCCERRSKLVTLSSSVPCGIPNTLQ